MRREILNGAHLNNLPVVQVVYAPRNMGTVAIQVTPETIGAMAIEFGVEILRGGNHQLLLTVLLERVNDKGDKVVDQRSVAMSDWLVDLGNEVHVFPDQIMWTTFSQLKDPAHEMATSIMSPEQLAKEMGIDLEVPPEQKRKISFMNLPPELQAPGTPDQPA